MNADQGYAILAGKCRTICEAIANAHPEFALVRGHYFCPRWGVLRAHWWLKTSDGVIYDPTREQFPSMGEGEYTEFNGMCECAQCLKQVPEAEAVIAENGNYAFCSDKCYAKYVGVDL